MGVRKVNARQLDFFEDNTEKKMAAGRKWSEFNEAIFEKYEKEKNNMVIRAYAGVGKSTQLRELVLRTPQSLVLAFNSNAKKEFEAKLKLETDSLAGKNKIQIRSKVLTFHGLGYRSLISHGVLVGEKPSHRSDRMMAILQEKFPKLSFEKRLAVAKLTRYMRCFVKQTDKVWMNGISRSGIYELWDEEDASEAVEIATAAMDFSVDMDLCPKVIDFEDMNYVPFKQGWQLDHAQVLFVDETQDLSEVQIAMLWRSKAKNARVIAVGDELQCHPGDTLIRLAGGLYAPIQTLKTGDTVMGWDSIERKFSEPRTVTVSRRQYHGPMMLIGTRDCHVEMTANHKVLVKWTELAKSYYGVFCTASDSLGCFEIVKLTTANEVFKDRAAWLVAEFPSELEAEQFLASADRSKLQSYATALQPMYPLPAIQGVYESPLFPVYAGNIKARMFDVISADGEEHRVDYAQSYPFTGVVYSLDVAQDHAYVANGVAVLNSIYAFRGADSFAMKRVIGSLKADVMPLPITYRCAQSIVRIASRFAPDIRARDNAPEGIIKTITPDEMTSMWRPGDLVISRANAPLVGYAIAAMKQGVPAYVEGQAEDMGIDTLLRKFDKSGTSFRDVLKAIKAWGEEEKRRFLAVDDPDAANAVDDRVATLLALSVDCSSSSEVMGRLKRLMSTASADGSLRLSTVHKAKGSEAERVFMLTWTFRLGGKDAIEGQEERNLYYVAVTRAKNELYFVKMEKPT